MVKLMLNCCFQIYSSKIVLRAAIELLCERAILTFFPLVSFRATRIILWDTVFVKSTSRSGDPIFLNPVFILGYTFALHLYSLHNSLYWRTMHSFPPTITTLIWIPFSLLVSANHVLKILAFFKAALFLCQLAIANSYLLYHTRNSIENFITTTKAASGISAP